MKPDIPEDLIEMAVEPKSFKENLSDDASNLFQMYERYRKDGRQRKIGKICNIKFILPCKQMTLIGDCMLGIRCFHFILLSAKQIMEVMGRVMPKQ